MSEASPPPAEPANPAPNNPATANPTPPGPSAATRPKVGPLGSIWQTVGAVLLVVFLLTAGTVWILDLSTSREVAGENRDVTVNLTNAISRRICACFLGMSPIGADRTAADATQQKAGYMPCLEPLPPAAGGEPLWMRAWHALMRVYYGRASEPTPWQAAQPHIHRLHLPADANFYDSVSALNRAISDERLQSIRAAEESGRKASIFQIMIIGIGALTTMVVSLRSMENLLNESLARNFSIAAILLSALGTGAASLNSFYGPQETATRQTRGLTQLKQLHQEVYVYLSAEPCSYRPMTSLSDSMAGSTDTLARRVRGWHLQLQQIVSGADGVPADGSEARRRPDDPGNSAPSDAVKTVANREERASSASPQPASSQPAQ